MATVTETQVHPTALVDESAELGEGVMVGPFCIVGPGVSLGARTRLAGHVVIERDTAVGEDCQISYGAVLGTDPQDLKYAGERTYLRVGDRTGRARVRHPQPRHGGLRAHAGGERLHADVVRPRGARLPPREPRDPLQRREHGGAREHRRLGDRGRMTPIHQFVRIGQHAFVGGQSRISKDIPPYVKAAGIPLELYGLNSVGLQRRGFSKEVRDELKKAYRIFFASSHNTTQALARAREELRALPEVEVFLTFFDGSERGVSL
jgi:UDP-N-acetylglucosamine acyltransferase